MSPDGAAPPMRFGLALPQFRIGATREGIDAGTEAAERLGWDSVWTTDHVLPDLSPRAADYAVLYEALATLAYVAGRTSRVRLGTSVIVVPMRNAVLLAREAATIDALSGGRLTLGVGVGWSEEEFSNVGVGSHWGEDFDAFTGCDLGPWRPAKPTAEAAATTQHYTVAKGTPLIAWSIDDQKCPRKSPEART